MENNRFDKNSSFEGISGKGKNEKKKQLTRSNAMSSDEGSPHSHKNHKSPNLARLTNHGSLDNHKDDFTDHNGMDLLQFIVCTLHKNRNDREMMLSLENQMRDFINNSEMRALRFPKMCSYNRMLVHRVAAFFGLDHNVDNTASQVVCTRTPRTRMPDVHFASLITNDIFTDDVQRNSRNTKSFDEVFRAPQLPVVQYRPSRNCNQDLMRRTKSVEADNYQRYYVFDNRPPSVYSSNGQLSNASTPTMPLTQSFKNLSLGSSIEPRLMENTLKESPNESQTTEEVTDESSSYPASSPFVPLDEPQPTPQYMYPVYDMATLQTGNSGPALGHVYVYDANTQVFFPQPNIDYLSTQLGVLTVNGPILFPPPGVSIYNYPYSAYNCNPGYTAFPQVLYPTAVPQTYYPVMDFANPGNPGPSSINNSAVQYNPTE